MENKNYYNTDYQFDNDKVRKLLARMKEKSPNKIDDVITYKKTELVINSVISAKYDKTLITFTDADKERLMIMLKRLTTTNLPEENVSSIVKFLGDNFTEMEIQDYVEYILKQYKPGMVFNGIRVSNATVVDMLEKTNIQSLIKGVIINKKYINDLIPFFGKEATDFTFNKDTLLVDTDFTDDMINLYGELDGDYCYYINKDIFMIASFDDKLVQSLKDKFEGLTIQSIPFTMFEWVNDYHSTNNDSGADSDTEFEDIV